MRFVFSALALSSLLENARGDLAPWTGNGPFDVVVEADGRYPTYRFWLISYLGVDELPFAEGRAFRIDCYDRRDKYERVSVVAVPIDLNGGAFDERVQRIVKERLDGYSQARTLARRPRSSSVPPPPFEITPLPHGIQIAIEAIPVSWGEQWYVDPEDRMLVPYRVSIHNGTLRVNRGHQYAANFWRSTPGILVALFGTAGVIWLGLRLARRYRRQTAAGKVA